jgi:hypothetical protein
MSLSIREILEKGPVTSKEIQARTGYSQPAVARKLLAMGDSIIKLPQGRSLHYAVTCNAFGANDRLPLVMVDAHGTTVVVAHIRPLSHGGFFVEAETGMPEVFLGNDGNGVFDDLPYFLYDLCPQGFIGRQIAMEMASRSDDFPSDPRFWNSNHIGRYLISNGDDLPGNLKLGEQAFLRIRKLPVAVSDEEYPELADSVMNGVIPGSSAGGEQPKFTAFSRSCSSHVIVKFSPRGSNSVAQRWRDILITEFHAAQMCHHYQVPAAETRLLDRGGRLFLEARRFDRAGEFGRLPMISLKAIDSEFTGLLSNWPLVMNALHMNNLVNRQHVDDVAMLWLFGCFINNTDMHLGNLSFSIDGNVFRLLPVYDMCSMGFAPKIGGEVLPYSFTPVQSATTKFERNLVNRVKKMAYDFWERIRGDERISEEFRDFLNKGNPVNQFDV